MVEQPNTLHNTTNANEPSEELTHVDEQGRVRMVDVSAKAHTRRVAVAEGSIYMHKATLAKISEGTMGKGDVFACARIAGIMATKHTADIIPLCHPIPVSDAVVELEPFSSSEDGGLCGIRVQATVGTTGQTGIEMEALTAASCACLTIYDMCKAIDRGMEIGQIRLLKKEGGRSGVWERV